MNCSECTHSNPIDSLFCNRCGNRLAAFQQTDERRQLTVLFADLVDSTRHAENLDPEEWSFLLQLYQSVCQRSVEQFDGHIAQYLGDGVLVYFGYPTAYEDSAARALLCALSIRDGLYDINPEISERLGCELQTRLGLHTGSVLVGKLGSGSNTETLALGSTPNIAARLQGIAPPDGIAVSQLTLDLAGDAFTAESLGKQSLKGVDDSISAALLSGLATIPHSRSPSRFVGRTVELERLRNMWANTKFGAPEAVLISGDPGIGKSSLVQAFQAELHDCEHHWLRIDCSTFQSSSPFASIITALVARLPDSPTDSLSDRPDNPSSWSRFLDPRVQAAVHDYLAIPAGANLPVIGSQIEKRELFINGVVQLLLKLASEQPLVVCVEDLHWADPSTLEVLAKLSASENTKVLLLMTARYEPDLAVEGLRRLKLGALDTAETSLLIGDYLAADQLEAIEALAERSDGIPLFAEELAKAVAGDLQPVSDDVPISLHDLLRAQLDQSGAARQIAHAAAILGRDFDRKLLLRTVDEEPAEAAEQINQLLTARIFIEHTPERLGFRHALIQEEAYSSILRRDRRRLHAEAATVLADEGDTPFNVLAYHHTAAAQPELAVKLWHKAAGQAKAAFAHIEALSHIRNGLSELNKLPESDDRDRLEIRFQLSLGQTLSAMRNFYDEDVTSAYRRAREISASIDDRVTLFRTLASLQGASISREPIEHSRELASQLVAMAETMPGVQYQVSAGELAGMTEYAAGSISQAIGLFRPITRQLEDAVGLSGPGPIANFADAYLGPAYWMAGAAEQAVVQTEAGLTRFRGTGNSLGGATILSCAAQVHILRKEFDRAASLALELKTLALELEHHQNLLTARYLAASAEGYSMRSGAALSGLLELNEQAKFEGLEGYFSWFQHDIGQCLISAGRLDEGREVVERAISVMGEFGGQTNLPPLLSLRATVLQESDPMGAESVWREALDIANAGGAFGWANLVLDAYGSFLARNGRSNELVQLRANVGDSIQAVLRAVSSA